MLSVGRVSSPCSTSGTDIHIIYVNNTTVFTIRKINLLNTKKWWPSFLVQAVTLFEFLVACHVTFFGENSCFNDVKLSTL